MYSPEYLLPFLDLLRAEVGDVDFVDVHTHIGSNDPDGYRCSREELVSALEPIEARGVVFPMHEPGGYPAANDMVIAEAEAAGGRLFPLCRLDPESDPLAEAERCLDAGARGIKLHPRAEGFALDHPALRPVLALADERRLPILCHAGRGIPALGRHALDACERHPGMRLILAHAAISDLAWIWRHAASHPNLFFDTSWWCPSDVQTLFALVPPGQILMASDAPYGSPAFAATMALRHGLQLGLGPAALRSVAGAQTARLLAGEEPLDAGPAPGSGSLPHDPLLDRIYAFLLSALGQMFNGVEPTETLALATLACHVEPGSPQATVCGHVLDLLEARAVYRAQDGRPAHFAPGLHLVITAAGLVRTPDVALPEVQAFASPKPG